MPNKQEVKMETKAKLFINGRSQAVRIPKAYQFEGVKEVIIRKEGDSLVIVPARATWESFAEKAPDVGDDFLSERPELLNGERVTF
jgi:antitoxin VapB